MNHPCKELIWVVQPDANAAANAWADYSLTGGDTIVDAKLQLNGQDRFSTREAGYFNLVNYASQSKTQRVLLVNLYIDLQYYQNAGNS